MHEKQIISFIEKLTHEKKILSAVLKLTKSKISHELSDAEIYRLATQTNIEESVLLHLAFYPHLKDIFIQIHAQAKKLGVLREKIPALLHGRDLISLGIHPSKSFSDILEYSYEAQMDGVFKTYEEALLWLRKELLL
jgi:tRNA nucleotidyltransferase (CCA-adding enzyme)